MEKGKKQIRVWTDGCFDMMHFGHANALRQAKLLGDYLVVGVHSDEDILKHKGPTVMNEEERYLAVAACKWVDEVVKAAPYVTELAVMDKYNCDICVHGDDIVVSADGVDTYHKVKEAGRFRTVPRTEGVSTTALVGRMLLMTKDHHTTHDADKSALHHGTFTKQIGELAQGGLPKSSPYTGVSHFLPSSRKIVQFSEGRDPTPDDIIVYADGGFDLFHVGHIDFLKRAKELGTYLIVGVNPDKVINEKKGWGYPVMNLHERVLSVLSCRYVDEVIIGAPWSLTEQIIKNHNIKIVVHGTVFDYGNNQEDAHLDVSVYEVPKKLGIYREIKSPRGITTSDVVNRVIDNYKKFQERNRKKEAKEIQHIQQSSTQ
eukprot:TRINITY_DN76_c0_g1_i2.p1 TRINITY_DN76_c0_g1~~TRINITY_DN76_c0_g1_i2.p1  ORF type:complete len:373 (-),score=75.71 TRINITY_DN76_c0_g1_i2:71-1189(-)